MFDIGWSELFLIGVVALIVIGPKDLPLAMRTVARFVRKMRGLGQEFHNAMSEVMREAELDELRRKMQAASNLDLGEKVREAVDPTGGLVGDFDPNEFANRLKRTVEAGPPSGPASAPPLATPPPPSPPPAASDGAAKAAGEKAAEVAAEVAGPPPAGTVPPAADGGGRET
jgi:sec-independent protein translocase protein TatB